MIRHQRYRSSLDGHLSQSLVENRSQLRVNQSVLAYLLVVAAFPIFVLSIPHNCQCISANRFKTSSRKRSSYHEVECKQRKHYEIQLHIDRSIQCSFLLCSRRIEMRDILTWQALDKVDITCKFVYAGAEFGCIFRFGCHRNYLTGPGRIFRELCEYEVMRWEGREVEKYTQPGH